MTLLQHCHLTVGMNEHCPQCDAVGYYDTMRHVRYYDTVIIVLQRILRRNATLLYNIVIPRIEEHCSHCDVVPGYDATM